MIAQAKHQRWLLMSWLVVFLLAKYAAQFLPGIGLSYLHHHFHFHAETIGLIAASYFYPYLLLQVPAGIIIDHCRLSVVLCVAMLCCALGMTGFAVAQNFSALMISRALMGAGFAFATVAYMRAAQDYFHSNDFHRLSGAFGTICMGGSGLIIMLCGWVYDQYGWHNLLVALSIIAWVMLILGVGFYFFERKQTSLQSTSAFNLNQTFSQVATILKSRNNWLLLAFNGLAFSPVAVFGGLWGKGYLEHAFSLSSDHATWATSTLFYGYALGGVSLPYVFASLKQQKQWMVGGITVALGIFLYMLYGLDPRCGFWPLVCVLSLIGFAASAFLASYTITRATNAYAAIATAIAIVNMGDPLFGAIAEPLMGKIMDMTHGNYSDGMLVLVVYWVLAIGVACCICYQPKEGGDSGFHTRGANARRW